MTAPQSSEADAPLPSSLEKIAQESASVALLMGVVVGIFVSRAADRSSAAGEAAALLIDQAETLLSCGGMRAETASLHAFIEQLLDQTDAAERTPQ